MQIISNISITDIYIKRNATHRGTPQNHGQSPVLATWRLNDLTSQCNEVIKHLKCEAFGAFGGSVDDGSLSDELVTTWLPLSNT